MFFIYFWILNVPVDVSWISISKRSLAVIYFFNKIGRLYPPDMNILKEI